MEHVYGKGKVFFGSDLTAQKDSLYPAYEITAELLEKCIFLWTLNQRALYVILIAV